MGKIKEKKLQKKLNAVSKKQQSQTTNEDDDEPQTQSKQKPIKNKHVDVFEVEDTENVNELKKFEDIDVFDYELPSDFEDEEIPSESDEELPAKINKSTKPSKSVNKKTKFLLREEDLLNEDFDNDHSNFNMEEEDNEEDEYQNLSELLDDEPNSKPQKSSVRSQQQDEKDEEKEYSSQEDNEDEINDSSHNKMLQSILDNNKTQKKKKKKKKEITELVPESEFNVKNLQQISMEDLMGTLNEVTGLTDMKKQIAKLNKKKQLKEPMPKLVEDRLTREAATKKTDRNFEKWREFSKELRNAPQLQFPLQEEEKTNLTTAKVVEEFHPITEMEKDIDQLLRATGVHKEQIEAVDDLEHRMLTEDELKRKEVELAKLAKLLFFEERKHKRQKKIKSKDYHRRLKKEREKNKLSLDELREIDPELAAQEEEKMLTQRIEERISLRHSKNKSSFSKHAHMHNEEARRAVQEQMEMKKQLMSKMHSMQETADSDSDPEEDMKQLQEEEQQVAQERKHSKIMNMNFMQKGFEKEQQDNTANDLNTENYEPSHAATVSAPVPAVIQEKREPVTWTVDAPKKVPVPKKTEVVVEAKKEQQKTNVKLRETTFAPEKKSQIQENQQKDKSKEPEESPSLNSTPVPALPTKKKAKAKEAPTPAPIQDSPVEGQNEAVKQVPSEKVASNNNKKKKKNVEADESNPWIAPENATKKASSENKRMTIKSQEREKKKKEGTIQIKMENAINLDNLDKKVKKANKFDLNANSSTEQQELINRAFTTEGIDYEAEFQTLKQREIEEEMPDMESNELPGWGSWGGLGVSVSQQQVKEKRHKEKQQKFEAVLQELQKRREDYTMGNVILNNGLSKQQIKYTVPSIPRNHTPISYEKTLLMPLGREWNTTSNFQNNIKPRVEVKEGLAIQPVSLDTVKRHEENLVKKEKLLKRQIGAANTKPEKHPPKKARASSKL